MICDDQNEKVSYRTLLIDKTVVPLCGGTFVPFVVYSLVPPGIGCNLLNFCGVLCNHIGVELFNCVN